MTAQVALLFLTRGPMPHEALWSMWLEGAKGLVPNALLEAAICSQDSINSCAAQRRRGLRATGAENREGQSLFSVYVHANPDFEGYPPESVFHGRLVPHRVKVKFLGS